MFQLQECIRFSYWTLVLLCLYASNARMYKLKPYRSCCHAFYLLPSIYRVVFPLWCQFMPVQMICQIMLIFKSKHILTGYLTLFLCILCIYIWSWFLMVYAWSIALTHWYYHNLMWVKILVGSCEGFTYFMLDVLHQQLWNHDSLLPLQSIYSFRRELWVLGQLIGAS